MWDVWFLNLLRGWRADGLMFKASESTVWASRASGFKKNVSFPQVGPCMRMHTKPVKPHCQLIEPQT